LQKNEKFLELYMSGLGVKGVKGVKELKELRELDF
jgi:hypothetical protein